MKKSKEDATTDYEQYEKECKIIRKENDALLQEFAGWMRQQGLSEKTIRMHLYHVDLFIQEFLLYEQPLRPAGGTSNIGMYLGYWFIRKGPVVTSGIIRSNATSLVKFYSFLLERNMITDEQLDRVRKTIKTEMAHWQERANRYNNPAITDQSKIWI